MERKVKVYKRYRNLMQNFQNCVGFNTFKMILANVFIRETCFLATKSKCSLLVQKTETQLYRSARELLLICVNELGDLTFTSYLRYQWSFCEIPGNTRRSIRKERERQFSCEPVLAFREMTGSRPSAGKDVNPL